jgi:hypothetical protein
MALGAPALSVKDFASYRQDLIVGMSLQVSAPLGQYDNSKLLNLGNNRWSFKPELGISKAWGPWTFEVVPSVTIFSDNTDFFGGNTFAQAPIYAVQAHILYTFQSGVWMALDGIYFTGGHTTLNGVKSDNEQRNTRAGFTLALPIDRRNSLKSSASTGISTRTGSEFSAAGIAWQIDGARDIEKRWWAFSRCALSHFCVQTGRSVSSMLRALAYSISASRAASQRSALENSCVDIVAPWTAPPSQLTTIRTWIIMCSPLSSSAGVAHPSASHVAPNKWPTADLYQHGADITLQVTS